jgi:hypothetical protein
MSIEFSLEYVEKLPCAASLNVSLQEWYIYYDFPGVDRRHKRHTLKLYHQDLQPQAEALLRNLKRYQELLIKFEGKGEVRILEQKMVAFFGYEYITNGLSMTGAVYDVIKDKEGAALHINSWKYAIKRARRVQSLLQKCHGVLQNHDS